MIWKRRKNADQARSGGSEDPGQVPYALLPKRLQRIGPGELLAHPVHLPLRLVSRRKPDSQVGPDRIQTDGLLQRRDCGWIRAEEQ